MSAILAALEYRDQGRGAEAERLALRSVEAQPNDAEAWHVLAILALEAGRVAEALERAKRAVDLHGSNPAHYYTLGLARGRLEDVRGAAEAFRIAAALAPGFAEAHHQVAVALGMLGDWAGVEAAARRALALKPDLIDARHRLGVALVELGRMGEAGQVLEEIIAIDPTHARVFRTLVRACLAVGSHDRAEAACRAAIALEPDRRDARMQLPVILAYQGEIDEAEALLRDELRDHPSDRARVLLATLTPPIAESNAATRIRRDKMAAELDRLGREGASVDATPEAIPDLFFLAYHGENDRAIHEALARLVKRPEPIPLVKKPGGGRKLRVGFASVHFRDHTVGRLMRGTIEHLPRERIEVVAISDIRHDDAIGRAIAEGADRFIAVGRDPRAARRAIAALGLDALVYTDIGMETFTYTIACTRLAPVQCLTWGHPATSGLETIDYFLSSELLETPEADAHYTERLVRLPRVPIYLERPVRPAQGVDRQALGLPADGALYACPQSLFKFHPDFDAILGEILRRDPTGWLVLIEGLQPRWEEMLLDRFDRTTPGLVDRIVFAPRLDHASFLALNATVDVLLDPIHFGGGHTTYEALALGAPVVTLPSSLLKGRITQALYRTMGVTSCIAGSPEEYVAIASRLGLDRGWRSEVSRAIEAASSAIFADARALGDLERFFLDVCAA